MSVLVLKGNNGKSRAVDDLVKYTDSICFVYYDHCVIYNTDSIFVYNKEHSLIDLQTIITEVMDENDDYPYTYLVVYTNEKEENLQEFIVWLNHNKPLFHCRDILITCK